jgi:hypothetical protein
MLASLDVALGHERKSGFALCALLIGGIPKVLTKKDKNFLERSQSTYF